MEGRQRRRSTRPAALSVAGLVAAWAAGLSVVIHRSKMDLTTELVFDALFIGTAAVAVCHVIIHAGRNMARVEHTRTRQNLAEVLPERVANSVSYRIGERTHGLSRRLVRTTTYIPDRDFNPNRSRVERDLMTDTGDLRPYISAD